MSEKPAGAARVGREPVPEPGERSGRGRRGPWSLGAEAPGPSLSLLPPPASCLHPCGAAHLPPRESSRGGRVELNGVGKEGAGSGRVPRKTS